MLSAICFNLDWSKILSSGNGLQLGMICIRVNPLPDIPILGSSNSAANKDMM